MLIFLDGPSLNGGGAILDGVAQPGLAFILFVVDFLDTSAFHFMMAAWEASELGTGWGVPGSCTQGTQACRL
jgi:hypothetical protein